MKLFLFLAALQLSFAGAPIWIEGISMEMPWRLCVEKEEKEARTLVDHQFEKIYKIFSLYNSDSELSLLNRAPVGKACSLSSQLAELLHFSCHLHEITEGRFDPTVGAVKKAWINALESKAPLTKSQIETLKENSGFDKILFKGESLTKKAALTIDLDGCAKGYAVDCIVEELQKSGHKNLFFEWSGDMRAVGSHPEGRAWQVAIPGKSGSSFPLTDLAIAGSGDYLQNWIGSGIEGEERLGYTHIVEPGLGRLKKIRAGSVSSATVAATSCALADALATSAMLIDEPQKLNQWIESVQKIYPKTLFWIHHRRGV